MSAAFVIPFNHQPASTGVAASTYTVPSGFYARVIVNVGLSASAALTNLSSTELLQAYGVNPGNSNNSVELWLKAGDVVAVSATNASGTATVTAAAGNKYTDSKNASTTATITKNVTTIATFYATSSAYISATFGGAGSLSSATFSGSSTVAISYEEFANIS